MSEKYTIPKPAQPMPATQCAKELEKLVGKLNDLQLDMSRARASARSIVSMIREGFDSTEDIELIAASLGEFLTKKGDFVGELIGATHRIRISIQPQTAEV